MYNYQVQADNNVINAQNVSGWLIEFYNNILPKRIKYGKYYDGDNEIVKQGAISGRPNYSINVNMAKYITDVATGYAFGKPITYTATNENVQATLDKVLDIHQNCSIEELDFNVGGDMSAYGVGYQLVMVKEGEGSLEDRITVQRLSPEKAFIVTDNTILREPLCGVYYYEYKENKQDRVRVYVYDKTDVYVFSGAKLSLQLESQTPHNMGDIPLLQSLNNDDGFGDYQQVMPLLDALSLAISNNTDDLQSIANAILCASGGQLSEEQVKLINEYKTANLPVGATMAWITKTLDSTATQQHLDNLLDFIFQISQVPDLTDDAFGGQQSGVAMRYKLWGLDQLWATKTKKYLKTIYKRLGIFLHLLQYQVGRNIQIAKDIDITFAKNLPADNSEVYQMVQALKGTVSNKTLLANIPLVDNVEQEMEQIAQEREEEADTYGFNNNGAVNDKSRVLDEEGEGE